MNHFPAPHADALLARTRSLIDAGRLVAARPLLAAAGRLGPDPARLAELTARLMLREGRPAEALAVLDPAIEAAPADPALRKLRAHLHLQNDDPQAAAADAAEAVILDRTDPDAKALLGTLLVELGRFTDAKSCLQEALAARPHDVAFWLALAEARGRSEGPAAQAACLADAVAANPGHGGLRNAAILHAVIQRDFTGAVTLARETRRAGLADATGFGLLGHALSSLGHHTDAAEAYGEALKLAPEDSYVRHLVASSGALPPGERAAPAYVRAVFDGYASTFDGHLLSLGYRVPGLIRQAVVAHRGAGPVLDLGCGTGLSAVACSDLGLGDWTGVDISAGMLQQAAAHGLYATLVEAELTEWLGRPGPAFPLILAGDVFCYFGPLAGALAAVRLRLAPGGLFVFSTEELAGGGDACALSGHGRYAHGAAHIVAAAAGFATVESRPEALRWEHGVAVAGRLTVLRAEP